MLNFCVKRSVAKSQNLWIKASSIHTAVGAAHGTRRDPIQLSVYSVDVVQQANLRLPIFVQKHMPGTICTSLSSPARNDSFLRREGVLQGQVEGCELCDMQPRIVGTMCIACDRLVCLGPRLKELDADGTIVKNRKLPDIYFSLLYCFIKSANSWRTISQWMGLT